ncbi:MAG: hypothetical protein APF84_08480 [Gracilibacter sp. BRH_c7a]|nr:MAG: hypothetical protein APF84_08480 [Gracilibacter sp. BRH_c7a]
MTYSLTPAIQDYLEVIHDLSKHDSKVRITDIARKLNVAKSSVTEAIELLHAKNLVQKERYGPITLTRNGEREAAKLKYKHLLISKFLRDVLNVTADTAEKDACLIEHVVSVETMLALIQLLESKNYLDNDIDIEEVKILLSTNSLSNLAPGTKGTIKRVEATGELRRRLMEMGVTSGDDIQVKRVAPMGDPIEITVKGYNLTLRKNEAAAILIEIN